MHEKQPKYLGAVLTENLPPTARGATCFPYSQVETQLPTANWTFQVKKPLHAFEETKHNINRLFHKRNILAFEETSGIRWKVDLNARGSLSRTGCGFLPFSTAC
jgi:hypothetical protein